jgi:hypothetical protein
MRFAALELWGAKALELGFGDLGSTFCLRCLGFGPAYARLRDDQEFPGLGNEPGQAFVLIQRRPEGIACLGEFVRELAFWKSARVGPSWPEVGSEFFVFGACWEVCCVVL